MQVQTLFDSWTPSSCPLPPRSQLYALEPIGVGTAWVESLSGYVARLAEAHSVSVGDLVGRVLSDVPNPKGAVIPPAARAGKRGGHGFRVCSYTLNGVTDKATTWVHALETATSRRHLRCLTLLPLRPALPDHLFHRHRAWCSLCYKQWRLNGQPIYEPLLWAIKASSHCPVHQRPLSHTCPYCRRRLNPLGVFSRPGYCERCARWLGATHVDSDQSPPGEEDQIWPCTQVGTLLAILPLVDPMAARESLRRSLNVYLEEIAGGNVLALAEYVRCPHSMLHTWLAGAALPRLENLLRIARYLKVPISSFYAPLGPTPTNIAAAKQSVAIRGKRSVSPSRHAIEIRRALLAAFDDAVPLSVTEIARRLGYTTTYSLYEVDRAICYKITARYRQSGGRHWWKKPGAPRVCETLLKEILEQSLSSREPTSVHQIAALLEHPNSGYIQQKFPELCAAIGKIVQAKQDRLQSIRRTLRNALHKHPPPTLTDLSHRLGYSHSAILRRHEPALCDQLMAQYRVYIAKRRSGLEKEAMAALRETPAPSLRAVCRRLDVTVPFMNKHFPAGARMIIEQHRRFVSAQTAHRRERLFHNIHAIAAELQSRGMYPSVEKVVERLPERSRCDWKTISSAVREARNVLATGPHNCSGFFPARGIDELASSSAGTPGVLREKEIHVISDAVAKRMTDFPHTV